MKPFAIGCIVVTKRHKPGEPEYDYGTVVELDESKDVAIVSWRLSNETYPESLSDLETEE